MPRLRRQHFSKTITKSPPPSIIIIIERRRRRRLRHHHRLLPRLPTTTTTVRYRCDINGSRAALTSRRNWRNPYLPTMMTMMTMVTTTKKRNIRRYNSRIHSPRPKLTSMHSHLLHRRPKKRRKERLSSGHSPPVTTTMRRQRQQQQQQRFLRPAVASGRRRRTRDDDNNPMASSRPVGPHRGIRTKEAPPLPNETRLGHSGSSSSSSNNNNAKAELPSHRPSHRSIPSVPTTTALPYNFHPK
mmetsp:Transcript_13572/g.29330  ORF Transcript_13572/g.29330 Transcript_13572/m.29330 type:complete len:243 (+) Transcript_13572:184-912(+)